MIIPVYNRGKLARRAIRSALSQEGFCNYEVVVVDDGSEPALDLKETVDRIRVVRLDQNVGPAAARNRGVDAAQGEYVAFLDSDDEWRPDKLARQLAVMYDNPDAAISVTDFEIRRDAEVTDGRFNDPLIDFEVMLNGCYQSPGSTMVVRRSVFLEVGHFDERLRRLEDWDWLLRATRTRSVRNVRGSLSVIHPSGAPPHDQTLESLAIIEQRINEWNLRPGQRRKFASALAYERAAVYFANRMWGNALYWLRRSLQSSLRYRVYRMIWKSRTVDRS